MRRLLLPAVLLALALPASAQAAFTIATTGSAVSKMGPFKPGKDARLAAAIRAFGTPTRTATAGKSGCRVEWVNFGLRIRFASFSGASPCDPAVGLAQTFSVRSRRFRTWAGLRPGDSEARISELAPGRAARPLVVAAARPHPRGDERLYPRPQGARARRPRGLTVPSPELCRTGGFRAARPLHPTLAGLAPFGGFVAELCLCRRNVAACRDARPGHDRQGGC